MANQIPQLKADILTALQTRLDASTRSDVAEVFVVWEFPNEWKAYLFNNNLTDTAQNRGTFVAEMMYGSMNRHYKMGKEKRNHASLPPATDIQP